MQVNYLAGGPAADLPVAVRGALRERAVSVPDYADYTFANGDVREAYAIRSTQREFEAAAVQAVSKWKFRPGKKGGRNVNTKMQVPIVFSITEE